MDIRKITTSDKTEYDKLRSLWVRVFEDQPSEVDALYSNLNANGYILTDNDNLASCLTTYRAGTLNGQDIIVIYAVCTAPEYRGQACGSKLVTYAKEEIESNGNIALTCPAEQSLVDYYSKLGFNPSHSASNLTVTIDQDTSDVPSVIVRSINYKQYGKYRESFLKDASHIVPTDDLLKQAESYSINGQGMLLINNGDAICIVDSGTDNEMFISELLVNPLLLERSSEIIYEIALGLAAKFETTRVKFHTLPSIAYSNTYIQAMSGNSDITDNPYYGLTLE